MSEEALDDPLATENVGSPSLLKQVEDGDSEPFPSNQEHGHDEFLSTTVVNNETKVGDKTMPVMIDETNEDPLKNQHDGDLGSLRHASVIRKTADIFAEDVKEKLDCAKDVSSHQNDDVTEASGNSSQDQEG